VATDLRQTATGHSDSLFKWLCLLAAVAAAGFLCWGVNDLRLELKETTATFKQTAEKLNHDLPRILANTKASTETLKALSQDVKNLRQLAGTAGGKRDDSLVLYADSLLNLIGKQDAKIGRKKLIGRKLNDPVPAKEWVVGARREAVVQAFRVRSKPEMLEKLGKTVTGSHWYIQFADSEPQPLIDWAKQKHPETAKLFTEANPTP
jgi:hypothetical protein